MKFSSIFQKHKTHHFEESPKKEESETKEEKKVFQITIKKLKVFESYSSYDRVAKKDLKILSYSEYMFIDKLIQDIKLIGRGLAGHSYQELVNNCIKESCSDKKIIEYLNNIAAKS